MVLLEKYFDVAFAAPNGVKKLRELILSLAMQGKLVAQDPHDTPASELLKEIEAEKNRLVKDGKIKQSKPLPEIKPDEVPYDLPKSWEWVRLGEIVSLLGDGIHGTPNYDDSGEYFFINGNNLSDGTIEIKENTKKIAADEYLKYKKELNARTVLVSINGTIGNVAFYDDEKVILGKSACYFNLFDTIDKQFTRRLLNSKYFLEYTFASATGSTIKNVSLRSMREFSFPLPPLAEQSRIVAKIDELMARCDELEKLRGNLNQKQITVHNAALNRLLTAKDQSDFNTAWQFITRHFGDLYSVKENVAELRKAILQLAVMGKLVPQDPIDRPASELLKEIEKEKTRLLKERKIKNTKKLPDIDDFQIPFEIPDNWRWTILGQLCFQVSDGPHYSPNYVSNENGVLFLSTRNIKTDRFDLSNVKYISQEDHTLFCQRVKPELGDILYTKGGTTGIAKVNDLEFEFSVWVHVAVLKISKKLLFPQYIALALNSPVCFEQSQAYTQGISNFDLGLTRMIKILLPLPPLAEQHRIVAKCDQLMTLCDNLEKQIDETNSKKTNLLNAVMTKFW